MSCLEGNTAARWTLLDELSSIETLPLRRNDHTPAGLMSSTETLPLDSELSMMSCPRGRPCDRSDASDAASDATSDAASDAASDQPTGVFAVESGLDPEYRLAGRLRAGSILACWQPPHSE